MIGLVVHGFIACLSLELFLRHGIAYKLRWLTLPVEMSPLMLGLAISGNVHQPSGWGALGIPLQWFAAGVIWHLIRVFLYRRKTDHP